MPAPGVGDERLDVVGEVEAGRLADLGRDVADEDAERRRRRDGLADLGQEQARQEARVEAARARGRSARRRRSRRARPREARTSVGVIHARSIAGASRDRATGRRRRVPSRSSAWRVSGVAAAGSDLAADREDAVHLADALLEVAALELRSSPRAGGCRPRGRRAARRRPGRRPSGEPGKRYSSSSLIERLGVGEGRDAAPDVADRRDPELVAEDAATSRRRRRP